MLELGTSHARRDRAPGRDQPAGRRGRHQRRPGPPRGARARSRGWRREKGALLTGPRPGRPRGAERGRPARCRRWPRRLGGDALMFGLAAIGRRARRARSAETPAGIEFDLLVGGAGPRGPPAGVRPRHGAQRARRRRGRARLLGLRARRDPRRARELPARAAAAWA
ncbi:MAG: hypothetical protein MZV70_49870 [Desulfobacterales bacterium]|nr:hypothetical protein [Desulfobacterales bacterium]